MPEQSTLKTWVYRKAVFSSILEHAQEKTPFETGGCLMGYWWRKYEEVVITQIIGPGPRATHKRHSFKADFNWQQDLIHKIYHQSGRHITYLGDWHTHPGGNHLLSWKDFNTLRKISKYKPAMTPMPLMGILYGDSNWTFDVWKYEPMKWLDIFPFGKLYRMQVEFLED